MKWKRIKPGQYEARNSAGELRGVIERSSMLPWRWWWSMWSETLDAGGDAGSLRDAKRKCTTAWVGR